MKFGLANGSRWLVDATVATQRRSDRSGPPDAVGTAGGQGDRSARSAPIRTLRVDVTTTTRPRGRGGNDASCDRECERFVESGSKWRRDEGRKVRAGCELGGSSVGQRAED